MKCYGKFSFNLIKTTLYLKQVSQEENSENDRDHYIKVVTNKISDQQLIKTEVNLYSPCLLSIIILYAMDAVLTKLHQVGWCQLLYLQR